MGSGHLCEVSKGLHDDEHALARSNLGSGHLRDGSEGLHNLSWSKDGMCAFQGGVTGVWNFNYLQTCSRLVLTKPNFLSQYPGPSGSDLCQITVWLEMNCHAYLKNY
eukprot:1157427-Pelagomonas_calceolata.AAC.1